MEALPDHPVWNELEKCFRTRIAQVERQQIMHVIREALSESPEEDLNELAIRVTRAVLSSRQGR